jgi:DNA-directed RNA polymerase sigma subunit (sigma70/sigma32)
MTDESKTAADRLRELRDEMSQEQLEGLRVRFETNPDSVSVDEVRILYMVTREKIQVFEAKARRKLGAGNEPPDGA